MDFNIELAQQLLDSENKFSVSFDLAWQWIGYSRKDSAKRSLLNSGFIQGEDLRIAVEPTTTGISGGDVNESIFLTIECFKMWGMMAKTSQGRQIRSYFLECEQVAKQAITQQFISTVAEPLVIMPTEQELKYMRSRAWEKAEMMGLPVPMEKIKQRTGYKRATDIVQAMSERTQYALPPEIYNQERK